MARDLQYALADVLPQVLSAPGFVDAARSDASSEVALRIPDDAPQVLRSFAASWYFQGLSRGVALTIATLGEE